jgi:hypothetical protein
MVFLAFGINGDVNTGADFVDSLQLARYINFDLFFIH